MTYLRDINLSGVGGKVVTGPFGELKTPDVVKVLAFSFEKPLNTQADWISTTTGTGSNTAQVSRSLLQTRTGGTGTAECKTKANMRYVAGSGVEVNFTARWTGTVATGDKAYIGLFEYDEDGFFVGYNGGDFVCGYINNGSYTTQTVDMSGYTLTNIHRFRILFGYLGVGSPVFQIHNGTEYVTLHRFQTDAALTTTHTGRPVLPLSTYVSAATNDFSVFTASMSADVYTHGVALNDQPFFHTGIRTVAVDAGQEAALVAFRNKATFGSYTNVYQSKVMFTEFATGSEGLYKINFYGLPAGTITDGSWSSVNTHSVLEVNTTTAYSTFGTPIFSTHIAVASSGTGVGGSQLDFSKLKMIANPGEEFLISKECIVAGAGNDATSWGVSYIDLF